MEQHNAMDNVPDNKSPFAGKREFFFSIILLSLFWLIISIPNDVHSPLWGMNLIQHILVGVALAALVSWQVKKPLLVAGQIAGCNWRNLIHFLGYLIYLLYEIIIAGIDVARRILRKEMLIQPQLVEFHTPLKNEIPVVINANSITLTPGTITVDLKQENTGSRFLVHCISDEAAQHIIQTGGFVKKIQGFCGQNKNDD
jgi:multicomponent Na+:H+ antiporter subunit E